MAVLTVALLTMAVLTMAALTKTAPCYPCYQATIVQESKPGTKGAPRSKARLLLVPEAIGGSGADGEDELLLITGRKPEESVRAKEGVRPVPPADASWSPTVGESCELLYLDGWWPVRPKSVKGEKWTVMYEAASQKHVVSRAQLRKVVEWDPEAELWVLSKAEALAAKLAEVPELRNKTQAKQICGKAIEIFWDGEDQWFEAEVRSLALVPLQPAVTEAATPCHPSCNPVCPGCNPMSLQVRSFDPATSMHVVLYRQDAYECEERLMVGGAGEPTIWRHAVRSTARGLAAKGQGIL